MNRSELRNATGLLAEKAKQRSGQPSVADIAEAHELFELRKQFLSDQIPSNIKVKYKPEPAWNSWSSISEFFDEYHAALVDLGNALAIPMAKIRLGGI
jgi:hypothetical protein